MENASQIADIRNITFRNSKGEETDLSALADQVVLIVNVASKCGLAPQYEQLEDLQKTYGDKGLQIIGFPCNQFLGQEPGSMEEILEYCSVTWGVTFPIMDKIRVNGSHAAPMYKALKDSAEGPAMRGPIKWNFEKFVLTPDDHLYRFAPTTKPDSPEVMEAITSHLPLAA